MMLHKVSKVARAMKMNNDALAVVIIVLTLSGCNQEDYQVVGGKIDQSSYRSDISPIGAFNEAPYKTQLTEEEPYLKPIFSGMDSAYVYMDNATVFSMVEEVKAIQGYKIAPVISYQYKVKQDIILTDGYCVSTWWWRGKNYGWSELNYECNQNYSIYSADDFMGIYGDMEVATGVNFSTLFPRVGVVGLEWSIR